MKLIYSYPSEHKEAARVSSYFNWPRLNKKALEEFHREFDNMPFKKGLKVEFEI